MVDMMQAERVISSSWPIPDPDSAERATAQYWRELRMMRSRPPGLANRTTTDGEKRADVFCAALEQSEQLSAAAATSGNAVKPLLAFYGLSQAVRALSAAKTCGTEWRVKRHGMSAIASDLGSHRLSDVMVKPDPKDQQSGFFLLQQVLGSAPWSEKASVGAIWAALPPLSGRPLPGQRHAPALKAGHGSSGTMDENGVDGGRVYLSGLPVELVPAGNDVEVVDDHLMSLYPALSGSRLAGSPFEVDASSQDSTLAGWRWRTPVGAVIGEMFTDRYGLWAIPGVGGSKEVTHPLTLWWALLFALSNRARYEPEGWFNDLNVDTNEAAVLIDYALRISLGDWPRLLHEALLAGQRTGGSSSSPNRGCPGSRGT